MIIGKKGINYTLITLIQSETCWASFGRSALLSRMAWLATSKTIPRCYFNPALWIHLWNSAQTLYHLCEWLGHVSSVTEALKWAKPEVTEVDLETDNFKCALARASALNIFFSLSESSVILLILYSWTNRIRTCQQEERVSGPFY